jgi:hypothetical protein
MHDDPIRSKGQNPSRNGWRLWVAPLVVTLIAVLVLAFAACGDSSPGQGASTSGQQATPKSDASSGNRSTSGVTFAFAECMRSHGVPNFPNPSGNGPVLQPGDGIDPASPQFQQALEACKTLAPPGWISDGPTRKP